MGLYELKKDSGRPLLPSVGLKLLMVSLLSIGKGPIDDMSQVLATCLPSFGPINGMFWIWLRIWMLMLFNALRLNAMSDLFFQTSATRGGKYWKLGLPECWKTMDLGTCQM
jgi:hypothetical protein